MYGPYEDPARLVSTLIVRGLQGKLPPLVGPETARDFVHVDDVVEAYLLAATHRGQEAGAVYNVGAGIQTTVREAVAVARQVLEISGRTVLGNDARPLVGHERLGGGQSNDPPAIGVGAALQLPPGLRSNRGMVPRASGSSAGVSP